MSVDRLGDFPCTANRVGKTGDDSYDVTGTLTMRGVAREITRPLTYLGSATDPWGNLRAGFEANTHVPR